MPDWFAHLMLAMVLATCLRLDPWKRTIFFIGNVMPDLVRILVVLDKILPSGAFYSIITESINAGSHSLAGVLAFSLVISILFEPSLPGATDDALARSIMLSNACMKTRLKARWDCWSRRPFFLLVLGGIAHLFLDTFMWPKGGGILWLFPINDAWFRWSFGAWWPTTYDGIAWLAPFFVAAIMVDVAMAYKRRHGGRA